VASGTPDELKRRVSGDVVTLLVDGTSHRARALLAGHPVVRDISVADDGTLRLTVVHGAEALPALLRMLDDAGITLHSVNVARTTLDDVFLTVTGRSLRDDSADAGQQDPGDRDGAEPLPPGAPEADQETAPAAELATRSG